MLVEPGDAAALTAALAQAAALPSPNPAARAAAAEHDVRRQAARMAAVLEQAVGRRRGRSDRIAGGAPAGRSVAFDGRDAARVAPALELASMNACTIASAAGRRVAGRRASRR